MPGFHSDFSKHKNTDTNSVGLEIWVQGVKCLLHKSEGLSYDPQHPQRARLITHVYTNTYTHIHKQKKITDYKVRNKIYNDNYSYLNYK